MAGNSGQQKAAAECRHLVPGATAYRWRSTLNLMDYLTAGYLPVSQASRGLMHRGGLDLLLYPLEIVKPRESAIELVALLLGELGLHLGNDVGKPGAVELFKGPRDIREHSQAFFGNLGDATAHDDLFLLAAREHDQDARPDRRDHRRMTGEHTEITFHTGNVDLIDLAGEGELFRRDEIEVEGSHGDARGSE